MELAVGERGVDVDVALPAGDRGLPWRVGADEIGSWRRCRCRSAACSSPRAPSRQPHPRTASIATELLGEEFGAGRALQRRVAPGVFGCRSDK